MACTHQCKVNDKIVYTIALLDENNHKCQVSIAQDVLRKTLKVPIKNKINFLKRLMKKRFKATINTRDDIISHLELQDCGQVEAVNNN